MLLWTALGACALGACHGAGEPRLFERLDAERTGIRFSNMVPEDTAFNSLNYLYFHNGGGVAVGDIDNDGLPDLYFTSNLGSNRLYLNKGDYRFEDVTARAGVADSVGWKTGATMADVNGDGFVDIYVSGVDYLGEHGRNVLYINDGHGAFVDRTAEYGLEFQGYSTQALFFDYDNDGDLDMYLLNHSVHAEHGRGTAMSRAERNPRAGDRLYRNDGGHFIDVSARAGIYGSAFGYGLGVVATDVDNDGCMDLYVANDFQEDDFLYHNRCDGTFAEVGASAMRHTSHSSMGVDAADFNNDGRTDIISVDMLPAREDVLKTSASIESYGLYRLTLEAGYRPQFTHNTLQLNRGGMHFSDIGYLAGVAATDWSWAPLFADFDNDGRKDLFITSGIYRRPNDLDYLSFVGSPAVQASLRGGITPENLTVASHMPSVPVPNHAFRNGGGLTFADVTQAWGLARPGFSNGAAYVDLNNSGALDLVVNEMNGPASIYRNRAVEEGGRHFVRVALHGDGRNTAGIGARAILWQGTSMQYLEQMPTRGFESSVDPRLHFGLGASTRVDSMLVVWPDARCQMLRNVAADRTITVSQAESTERCRFAGASVAGVPAPRTAFTDVTASVGIDWTHRAGYVADFDREPLLPHDWSAAGPAVAVSDVNGDGLEDLYVGGGTGQAGALFLQQRDGHFTATAQPAFAADELYDDVDAVFVDANGDGHPDLYVVSGGYDVAHPTAFQDRLYLNDGRGVFRGSEGAVPALVGSGACVRVADFNGDGHPDLFVGRRALPTAYGVSPPSYLLENDGHGRFVDVTKRLAPDLGAAGMVTSAAWLDYDHDRRVDLVVSGEWMPVRVFHQENGRFVDRTKDAGLADTNGWWNDVTVADVNGDSLPDLVLGNLGLNSYLTASRSEPARLYVGDFAHLGQTQTILTVYKGGVSYPVATRDELLRAIPRLRERFPTYASFGASRIGDILPEEDRVRAHVLEAYDFATSVAIDDGNGAFTMKRLPMQAQLSPVFAIVPVDSSSAGTDLLLAGNEYGVPPLYGRYDASYGLLLRARGHGRFEPVDLRRSGLVLDGQVRHMKSIRAADGSRLVVVARYGGKLQLLRVSTSVDTTP